MIGIEAQCSQVSVMQLQVGTVVYLLKKTNDGRPFRSPAVVVSVAGDPEIAIVPLLTPEKKLPASAKLVPIDWRQAARKTLLRVDCVADCNGTYLVRREGIDCAIGVLSDDAVSKILKAIRA